VRVSLWLWVPCIDGGREEGHGLPLSHYKIKIIIISTQIFLVTCHTYFGSDKSDIMDDGTTYDCIFGVFLHLALK